MEVPTKLTALMTCVTGLLMLLQGAGAVEERCRRIVIREREKLCNPTLGVVTTAILASDGKDYTEVCRSVEEYVQCMEPSISDCEPSRVFEYWNNKMTYTGEPYWCEPSLHTVHNVSRMDDKIHLSLDLQQQNVGSYTAKSGGVKTAAKMSFGGVFSTALLVVLFHYWAQNTSNCSVATNTVRQ